MEREELTRTGDDEVRLPKGEADPATVSFVRYRMHGERSDLERALLACAPTLLRAARRYAREDAEDLLHECFIAAIRGAAKFDEQKPLLPWLLGILGNAARMRRARGWRRVRKEAVRSIEEAADDEHDPVAALSHGEWLARVRTEVERLPEIYRPVLLQYLVAGERPADIAARLRRSPSTVRTQLERGLRELRRRLPVPMLAALSAVLASRSASAGNATQSPRRALRRTSMASACVAAISIAWWQLAPETPSMASVLAGAPAVRNAAASDPAPAAPERGARTAMADADRDTVRVRLDDPAGSPLAGVAVALDPAFEPGVPIVRTRIGWRIATTDGDGEALFRDVPHHAAAVRLGDRQVLHAFEASSTPRTLAFTVEPGALLRVRLVDADERPIADGTVFVSCAAGVKAPGLPAARTDENGEARVPVFLSPFFVWAAAPGRTTTAVRGPFRSSNPAREQEVVLRAEHRAHRFRGRVQRDDGEPIAGATVALWHRPAGSQPPTYCGTDAHGWFEAEGPEPGPWTVAAIADGFTCSIADPDDPWDVPVLRPRRGGAVDGRVHTTAERAASLRVVTRNDLCGGRADNPLDGGGAAVAADGAFHLEHLSPGEHEVALLQLGAVTALAQKKVAIGEGPRVRVEFDAAAAAWEVVAEYGDGTPVAGCLVRAESPQPRIGFRHEQQSIADERGSARLALRDSEPQRLFVFLSNGVSINDLPTLAVEAALPERTTRIVVPDSARLAGSVRGLVSQSCREIAARHGLEIARMGGARTIRADADGAFAAVDVPAGDYELRLRHPDLPAWLVSVARFTLAPGEVRDLGLLPDPGLGAVVLELPSGAAASRVHASVRDASGRDVATRYLEAGRPQRGPLPRGTYTLVHASSRATTVARTFVVVPGEETTVVLERTPGTPFTLEVHAERGCPSAAPLWVTLQSLGGAGSCDASMPVAIDGKHWVLDADLQPGVYRFVAHGAWGGDTAGTFVIDQRAARCTFPFRMP